MSYDNDLVTLAAEHVMQAEAIVAAQRRRIALLQSVGANANDAKRLLETFEIYLTIFKDHLRELRQKPP